MEKRGSVTLSNVVLHPIRRSCEAEIALLKGKAHVCLIAPLYHDQTECC